MSDARKVEYPPVPRLNTILVADRQGKQYGAEPLAFEIRLHGPAHDVACALRGDGQVRPRLVAQVSGRAAHACRCASSLGAQIAFVIETVRIARTVRAFQRQSHTPPLPPPPVGKTDGPRNEFAQRK